MLLPIPDDVLMFSHHQWTWSQWMGSRETVNKNQIATLLVRIALGFVFIYASLDKIANPIGFATVVGNYQILPSWMVPLTAVGLPWIEAACGIALVIGRLEQGAAMLISLMMVAFIGVTLYNGYRGLDIACGCFTLSAKEPSSIAVNTLRNVTLLLAGTWVLFNAKRWQSARANWVPKDMGE
jgi:uncharacterized membrane protein YphA (DoxX/SURF4 family)